LKRSVSSGVTPQSSWTSWATPPRPCSRQLQARDGDRRPAVKCGFALLRLIGVLLGGESNTLRESAALRRYSRRRGVGSAAVVVVRVESVRRSVSRPTCVMVGISVSNCCTSPTPPPLRGGECRSARFSDSDLAKVWAWRCRTLEERA
jgi:hypothetical protein